jgi:hypothetical protein
MLSQPCTVPGCSQPAWHACERCQRPYCDVHTRWLPRAVRRDIQGETIIYELVCYDCLPRSAEARQDGDGSPTLNTKAEAATSRRYVLV